VNGNPGWTAALFLGRSGSNYTLTPVTYDDAQTWLGGNAVALNNAWNVVEIE